MLFRSNYTVLQPAGLTANITPANLQISGITAAQKTYDGLTAASVSTAGVVKSGLFPGDDVTISASGVFADKNAGQGKTVTLTSNYGGADVGNYSITGQSATTANITPAPLRVSANDAIKYVDGRAYSGGNGVSYSGLVNGEAATVLAGSLAFGGSSQGASSEGRYAITPHGLSSNNYNISYADGALSIRPSLTAASPVPLSPTVGAASPVAAKEMGQPNKDGQTYPWPPGKKIGRAHV